MRRSVGSGLLVAIAVVVIFDGGSGAAMRAPSRNRVVSPAQALRTCVDRWNQDNMLGWGPRLASIAVRRLKASEQAHLGIYSRARRCTVSLSVTGPRDLRAGCSAYGAVMPGYPELCVSTETTFVCLLDGAGGYECSFSADGAPPLRNKNATTDRRGVLTLDVPLKGTHATPPLPWQRRYPHVDSFIVPWTSQGKLRPGLTLDRESGKHYRGACIRGSEHTSDKTALKCVSDVQFDPCYAPTADWNHPGVVVACGGAGSTRFDRFVITRRF